MQTLAGAAAVNNRIVANAITIWALIRNLMMCFILLFFFSVTLFVLVLAKLVPKQGVIVK
ncbi:hypothetical protein D3C71_2172640 [compost metagenome]